MKNKLHRPLRIFLDTWLARFGSVFGWAWLVFWGMVGLVGLTGVLGEQNPDASEIAMSFFCLGLAALHGLLIRSCRSVKELVSHFHQYCAYFAGQPEKSISQAARALNEPPEEVAKRLQKMCRRGYFNGYIDHQRQRMVFAGGPESLSVVRCPGCGAGTAIAGTGGLCRYCASPLQRP